MMYFVFNDFAEWMFSRKDENITEEKVRTFLREQGLEKLFNKEEYLEWEEEWNEGV